MEGALRVEGDEALGFALDFLDNRFPYGCDLVLGFTEGEYFVVTIEKEVDLAGVVSGFEEGAGTVADAGEA